MSNLELQNWANKIDIWKDKKSDGDFVDIKNKLVKDMENLWNLKLQWKITQEEYSRYWMKFREILEKNFTSKKEIQKRYEETRKEIMEETKSKTKWEQKGLLSSIKDKIGFGKKEEINLRKDFWIIIEEHRLDSMAQIHDKWLQNEFKIYLSNNPEKRNKFLKNLRKWEVTLCPSWIKNQAKNQQEFEKMIIDLEKIELDDKIRKNKDLLIKRIWPELWENLIKEIDKQLNINPCKFNLIKVIENYNKKINIKKYKKLTNKEILSFTRNFLEFKKEEIETDVKNVLNSKWVNHSEYNKKTPKQKLELLKQVWASENFLNNINWLNEKLVGLKVASDRSRKITEKDIDKIIKLIDQWKTNKEIINELEKQNKDLKKYNDSLKNSEKPEQSRKSNPIEQKLSSQISSSSIISIPWDFGWVGRKEYFKIMLESVAKNWEKIIKNPAWLNFKLSKDWNWFYKINYWWIEHWLLKWEEIPKAISFGNFTAKLGLDFLLPFSSKILQKINSKELLVKDGDWLKRDEKNIIMNKIGKVIFWKDYNPTDDTKKNREQFKTDKAKNMIGDLKLELQNNPSKINGFLEKLT